MRAVSVSGLKNNPAEALRQAKSDMVVVLNRDHPDALLVGLDQGDCCRHPVSGPPWPRPCSATVSSPWPGPPAWPTWTPPPSSPISRASASRRSA